jgi:hypothetical protein
MKGIFYHWSPRERRNRINRVGLVPGNWSRDRLWKPPYICLAPTVLDAWALSGAMDRGRVIKQWDLWEVDVREQSGYEELFYDTGRVKEIRVYERIFKRNVWFVGERTNA